MATKATFVLIHGSCHGGWCWKKLIPILENHGHKVYTPTLTGLGERSHLLRENIDLNTHIQDIIQGFEYEDLKEVILVGHSYGGLVIGGIAEIMPQRIKLLVNLDGYIPSDGKSTFDLVPSLKEVYEKRSMKDQGKAWLVFSYEPQDFGVTNPEDIAWMKSSLGPMPIHTHDQTLKIQNPKSKKLPKSYISCSEFGDSVVQRVELGGDWNYQELKRGHDVIITAPNELSQILLKISGL